MTTQRSLQDHIRVQWVIAKWRCIAEGRQFSRI